MDRRHFFKLIGFTGLAAGTLDLSGLATPPAAALPVANPDFCTIWPEYCELIPTVQELRNDLGEVVAAYYHKLKVSFPSRKTYILGETVTIKPPGMAPLNVCVKGWHPRGEGQEYWIEGEVSSELVVGPRDPSRFLD